MKIFQHRLRHLLLTGLISGAVSAETIELSDIGTQVPGLRLNGINPDDNAGTTVSGAGDINGDGFVDLLIAAATASPNGNLTGQSYVVFGGENISGTIELSDVGGTVPGLVLNGFIPPGAPAQGSFSGSSLSDIGDFNNDGIDDIIVGAFLAAVGDDRPGQGYVIFGNSGLNGTIELSDVGNSVAGITLNGTNNSDNLGTAASAAGDFNNDGIDDLVISSSQATVNGINSAGQIFIVYGSTSPTSVINTSDVGTAVPGVTLNGFETSGFAGQELSDVGDFNGDGIDDVIIAAPPIMAADNLSGQCFLVFGGSSLNGVFELSELGASLDGIVFNGANMPGNACSAVAGVEDTNRDGFDDVLIGDTRSFSDPDEAGSAYLVYGSSDLSGSVELADVGTTVPGVFFNGVTAEDNTGHGVSSAGFFNGDGLLDLIIGAPYDRSSGVPGRAYIVFGSNQLAANTELSDIGTTVPGIVVNGVNPDDTTGRSVSSVGDFNNDGLDDVIISASGADPNGDRSGQAYVIFSTDLIFADGMEGQGR